MVGRPGGDGFTHGPGQLVDGCDAPVLDLDQGVRYGCYVSGAVAVAVHDRRQQVKSGPRVSEAGRGQLCGSLYAPAGFFGRRAGRYGVVRHFGQLCGADAGFLGQPCDGLRQGVHVLGPGDGLQLSKGRLCADAQLHDLLAQLRALVDQLHDGVRDDVSQSRFPGIELTVRLLCGLSRIFYLVACVVSRIAQVADLFGRVFCGISDLFKAFNGLSVLDRYLPL